MNGSFEAGFNQSLLRRRKNLMEASYFSMTDCCGIFYKRPPLFWESLTQSSVNLSSLFFQMWVLLLTMTLFMTTSPTTCAWQHWCVGSAFLLPLSLPWLCHIMQLDMEKRKQKSKESQWLKACIYHKQKAGIKLFFPESCKSEHSIAESLRVQV